MDLHTPGFFWCVHVHVPLACQTNCVQASLLTFAELASMFPNRAGAEVVYLEQAYTRPRYLVSVTYAVTAVLISFVLHRSIFHVLHAEALFRIGSVLQTQLYLRNIY